MAFHRDAELAGLAIGDACDVALALHDLFLDIVCGGEKAIARGCQAERIALPVEEFDAEVVLDGLHLMGQRGLGKIQALACFRDASRFSDGDDGAEVAKLKHGWT